MGTVYRAHDPLIDRTVAIKTVACNGLSREEAEAFEQRFYLEAKSAGRLNHPNIVTIHDVGRSDDLAYIAMEFLNGQTLRDILDSGLTMPAERCAEIAAEVADGLAFAHANEVVHRDIKPANIMVLDNGAVKIADFGVALIPSGSLTVSGTAFGSPKYMSPEQVTGQKADGRSDVFSLGVVLYEMLAGRPPFAGDNVNAILYQVLNSAPPLPSSYHPNLPQGFDRIVARALAKDPDKRFQSAAEMASALRKYRRLAKMAQKKPAAATSTRSAQPGDATVPLKTLKAGKTTRSAWPQRALRFGLPLLGLAVLAGWLLHQPTEPPQLAAAIAENTTQQTPDHAPPTPPPASAPAAPTATATPEAVPPVATTPAEANGRIRLAIAPWGEVYVDGKMAGVTPPLTELLLPPGKHRIEIRNADFAPHRRNIDLAADANLRIKHKFE
ncbi:serine/threonine-protein kinase [Azonexus sp. IMCC34842]|uniref:serine/threonine-protein kinase n=1 Tax=Azonexus sp. IMCC34842 TaxID=3420950 RepID=UPI003D105E2C